MTHEIQCIKLSEIVLFR